MATRVVAAQEGPDEAVRQKRVLRVRKKCLLRAARWWVSNELHHHDQVAECRGKTCKTSWRTRCVTMMTRDANRVSEVKHKNFVEQCVRHLPGNAGRLFLHENLWDKWSRGLSFAMKMSEGPDVRET